jgi:hypothetical protein
MTAGDRSGQHGRDRSKGGKPLVSHVAAALLCAVVGSTACVSRPADPSLPAKLSDDEFWRLVTDLSELPGAFAHSENLVSNEREFARNLQILRPLGGVYVGVGPEQNFSYIARLQPIMAFIVDIRRENRNLHLMYKALFELSVDRADFLSRLFSRVRPDGLDRAASVDALFSSYAGAAPSRTLLDATLGRIREWLVHTHRFPLAPEDLAWIEYAMGAFHTDGPEIHYGRSRPDSDAGPSYRVLMTETDIWRRTQSYLATEEAFELVKSLQARNLVVPIVGDFAGPSALRGIADYLRKRGGIVRAFYASNVEIYLSKQQAAAFCHNLELLPYDFRSRFIVSRRVRPLAAKVQTCPAIVR